MARMSSHVKRKSFATRLRGDKQSKAQLLDSIPSWNTHVGSNRHQMPECATELLRVQAKTCLRQHVGGLCGTDQKKATTASGMHDRPARINNVKST